METLAEYQARTARYKGSFAENKNNAAHYFERAERMVMFTLVDEDTAKEIEQSARLRGAVLRCINNLDAFYVSWSEDEDNEGKTFLVGLNDSPAAPFPGKITDSLYTSFNNHLKTRKEEWRLIKNTPKDGDEKYLYIAHL